MAVSYAALLLSHVQNVVLQTYRPIAKQVLFINGGNAPAKIVDIIGAPNNEIIWTTTFKQQVCPLVWSLVVAFATVPQHLHAQTVDPQTRALVPYTVQRRCIGNALVKIVNMNGESIRNRSSTVTHNKQIYDKREPKFWFSFLFS